MSFCGGLGIFLKDAMFGSPSGGFAGIFFWVGGVACFLFCFFPFLADFMLVTRKVIIPEACPLHGMQN